MGKKALMKVLLLVAVTACWSGGCAESLGVCQSGKADANAVEMVLGQLTRAIAELKSYQGQIEYRFSQPVLESQTLRKGVLYYAKFDEQSALRINFQALRQDDEEEQKYIEQYIFDGVWLTHIDYQIKEVKRRQLAEPNEPVDAFELARRNFPIVGFSQTEEFEKEFEIKLVKQQESEQQDFIRLHLKVKPDSIYKDDYTSIDFWIDKKLYLPAKIIAASTEEDICEIKFIEPKVNEKLDKRVFEVKMPKGFTVEVIPLKKSKKKIGQELTRSLDMN